MNLQHSMYRSRSQRYIPTRVDFQSNNPNWHGVQSLADAVHGKSDSFKETQQRIEALSELDVTLRRLRSLQDEDYDSDEERAVTLRAIDIAEQILTATATNSESCANFWRGWASPYPDFGVRIEWEKDGRHLRLVVGGSDSQPGYVYMEDPAGTKELKSELSVDIFANGLRWITEQPALVS